MKYVWFALGAVSVLAISAAAACVVVRARRQAAVRQADRDRTLEIIQGIRRHAAVFDGLYEGLYQAAQNQEAFFTDAYEEWCDRVGQLDDEAFRQAFSHAFAREDLVDEASCRDSYAQLLACIGQAGLRRLHESGRVYTADEAMQQAYYLVTDGSGGARPVPGEAYTVLASAWEMDGKLIEHGTVMPAAGGQGGTDDA